MMMEIENIFIVVMLLFNLVLISFFDKIKLFHIILDRPDGKRKLHKKPVPLAGGIIIFLNLAIYFIFISNNQNLLQNEIIFNNYENLVLFFATSFLIFFLGFMDDKFNISASKKFFIISIIIILILYFDNSLNLKIIKFSFWEKNFYLSNYSMLLTCFCFLVFLNAFNMFDGINLQSGIYSAVILLSILNFYDVSLIAKIILISILTYSYLNMKNKSFLGDSGSLLVAFIIGYFFIKLYNFELVNYTDEVVIYMLVPGIDLIRLFFKRIIQKRNPLSSDRYHLHHLLLLKFSFEKTLIILTALIILPISLSYFGLNKLIIISIFLIIYSILLIFVSFKKLS
jgi:UDP-GlcNAc:undecaprenyl-phosphate GlcNAc-1-phosphate transferase